MSVVVSVEDVGPCRKQLTVEVPAPAVEAETERVLAEYGRRVKIPGFRPGKVPRDVVKRRYGKDIEHEVVERLLPRYWRQAQAESSIEPLLPPEVERVDDLTPGSPLTFVATVETRPAIELRNTRDFDLPDPPVEPGTVEVEDALEEVRRQYGRWTPVDRPAARADLARIDVAPEPPEPGKEPDQVDVEVGDPNVWEELTLALQGLAAGQETVFTRRDAAPGGGREGDQLGEERERRFRVKVREVQERDLPPLDDDFARGISPDFQSAEDLRQAVVARLRHGREHARREQRQTALLDQLRERHPMELPQGVVRQEVEHLVNDYAEGLARRGVNVNQAGIDWNDTAERMRPAAEKRVHGRLLLDAVAEAESIDVSEEEFEATLAALARAQGTTAPALRRSLDDNGRLGTLRAQLRRDKTLRRLLGEAGNETSSAGAEAAAGAPGEPES